MAESFVVAPEFGVAGAAWMLVTAAGDRSLSWSEPGATVSEVTAFGASFARVTDLAASLTAVTALEWMVFVITAFCESLMLVTAPR